MAESNVDQLLLSIGSDLPYLTGYRAMPLERLTMAVVGASGPVTLVVPRLEAPRVDAREPGFLDVVPWDETDDPVALVADVVGTAGRVALGDETWSTFLLQLQDSLAEAQFVAASPLMAQVRIIKDDGELTALRLSAHAADRVADRLAATVFSNRSERDLAAMVGAMLLEEGCDAVSFVIVASGPNSASPHHEPGERVIQGGDAVIVDFGGSVRGYHSDTTRTFHVGEPPARFTRMHDVVEEAQRAGVAAVETGVTAQSVDRAARSVINEAGFGDYFIHRTGHGIGLDVHETPYIVEGNDLQLAPGMTFSVEPGIYVPGEFGVRIEDIVAVVDEGADRLNISDRSVRIVG
ncbi:MAG: aminopeptidase P family protein [Acidimicrobiia bacterium]|nr:aminopeptidase P family protein [Acidimicrobiia bacterium]